MDKKICCWCDEPILQDEPALKEQFFEDEEPNYFHLSCKAEEEDNAAFDNDFGCNG